MVTTKTWAQWTAEGSKSPIETDGYIIYRVPRTVCRTRSYTALAVPLNGLGSVDPRGGDWRAMRLPVIDCRAMMHGASVSSNKDVASQLPFSNLSVMFRRRVALLTCVLALCAAGAPAHARGEHGGFGASGGFGGFFGGGHAMQTGGQEKGAGRVRRAAMAAKNVAVVPRRWKTAVARVPIVNLRNASCLPRNASNCVRTSMTSRGTSITVAAAR